NQHGPESIRVLSAVQQIVECLFWWRLRTARSDSTDLSDRITGGRRSRGGFGFTLRLKDLRPGRRARSPSGEKVRTSSGSRALRETQGPLSSPKRCLIATPSQFCPCILRPSVGYETLRPQPHRRWQDYRCSQ